MDENAGSDADETVEDEYADALKALEENVGKKLSISCKFKDIHDEIIRDQLINRTNLIKIQEKLFNLKNPTFEKTIDLARRMENTSHYVKEMSSIAFKEKIEQDENENAAVNAIKKTIRTSSNGEFENGGKTELDEYLTNIKWLSQLSCKGLIPQLEINCTETKSFKTCRSQSKERPPKSYSEIIHLAISSSQAKRMTLKQIYTWVEDHFPYYRDCAKPGWKNSIRHTLSTRDIFVRETGENEKVTFWTLKTHSDSNLSQIKTFPLQGEQLSSLHSVKSHKSSMACSGILAAGFLGRTQTRWQPKSKKSHKEEKREKRIKPILPRGSAAVLIPVLVGPPLASANVQKSAQLKKARPALIAPKLPFLLQNQNVYPERFVQPVKETSVLEATTWKVTEPQRIVSKRWKGYRARRHEYRRTRKPRSCHQRHIGCPSSETNLNVMSPMNSSPTNQSSYVNVLISPSKTPSQMAVPEGVSTSTPCKHAATVLSPTSMLLSLLPGITPPKVEDDVLDFSLLKSPNDESLGYISLGFPDSIPTTSEPEDPDHDLGELQGFAPIDNDSFTETLGADQHNESFSKFFSDYSTPNLGEGIDMANLNWSYIFHRN
ncbi:forkhead box protein M1-like [Pleurodeles waltl]|uniref:forkhead box protein M1-like n=1 Tax=Pleurodeles waltl TaxID=8319 RepID=UPI003709A430